ncbi:MAG: zf-TFIIB domain-containing protein [Acidobacteria bacterium]|nr:zf-TFIIB domain-containing protein [Acidobacteriota bacterium]
MRCPKCPGRLEPRLDRSVNLDRCPRCYGLWFQRDEVAKFNQFDPDFPLTHFKRLPGKPTRLRCPQCKGFLDQTWYAPGADLEVDRCTNCEGVWLDEDEIEKVRRILKGELKSRRKELRKLAEVVERERTLHAVREAEIAQREATGQSSRSEWWFMFLTGLPREVYNPVHRFPKVTVSLIVLNLVILVLQVTAWTGPNAERAPTCFCFHGEKFTFHRGVFTF